MKKNKITFLKNQKAFTLVELMVSIAIIMILMGLFAPNLAAMITRAKYAQIVSNAKQFQHTLEMYSLESQEKGRFQQYPRNAQLLMASDAWKDYKPNSPYYFAFSGSNFANIFDDLTLTKPAYAATPTYPINFGVTSMVSFTSMLNVMKDGSTHIFIYTNDIYYRNVVTTGYLSNYPCFKGTIFYFPFALRGGAHRYPILTDSVIGYEIRAFNEKGYLIPNFKINGNVVFN